MAISTEQPGPPTARYHEKREALMDAAARLFNSDGVKGATLARIAASVGLVTNSVTYYYRKKEDLARACFLRSIAALDALAAGAVGRTTVAERLQSFFRGYAQLLADMESGRHPQLLNFNDIRSLPSEHCARSGKMSSPPATPISSETHLMHEIGGSSHSSK